VVLHLNASCGLQKGYSRSSTAPLIGVGTGGSRGSLESISVGRDLIPITSSSQDDPVNCGLLRVLYRRAGMVTRSRGFDSELLGGKVTTVRGVRHQEVVRGRLSLCSDGARRSQRLSFRLPQSCSPWESWLVSAWSR